MSQMLTISSQVTLAPGFLDAKDGENILMREATNAKDKFQSANVEMMAWYKTFTIAIQETKAKMTAQNICSNRLSISHLATIELQIEKVSKHKKNC